MRYINGRYMSEKGHIVDVINKNTRDKNVRNISSNSLDMFYNLHNLVFHISKTLLPDNCQRGKNIMENTQTKHSVQSGKMVQYKTKQPTNRIQVQLRIQICTKSTAKS